eukprot:6204202-Pleurochrysis_carterae.AAC.1
MLDNHFSNTFYEMAEDHALTFCRADCEKVPELSKEFQGNAMPNFLFYLVCAPLLRLMSARWTSERAGYGAQHACNLGPHCPACSQEVISLSSGSSRWKTPLSQRGDFVFSAARQLHQYRPYFARWRCACRPSLHIRDSYHLQTWDSMPTLPSASCELASRAGAVHVQFIRRCALTSPIPPLEVAMTIWLGLLGLLLLPPEFLLAQRAEGSNDFCIMQAIECW